jgi:hypothetical protein
MPCSPAKINQRFGEIYRLHLASRRVSVADLQYQRELAVCGLSLLRNGVFFCQKQLLKSCNVEAFWVQWLHMVSKTITQNIFRIRYLYTSLLLEEVIPAAILQYWTLPHCNKKKLGNKYSNFCENGQCAKNTIYIYIYPSTNRQHKIYIYCSISRR